MRRARARLAEGRTKSRRNPWLLLARDDAMRCDAVRCGALGLRFGEERRGGRSDLQVMEAVERQRLEAVWELAKLGMARATRQAPPRAACSLLGTIVISIVPAGIADITMIFCTRKVSMLNFDGVFHHGIYHPVAKTPDSKQDNQRHRCDLHLAIFPKQYQQSQNAPR